MGLDLTAQQVETVDAVLEGVDSGDHAVIEGPAGTGKSTLMSALILEAVYREYRVAISAPTHKAAKVLSRMLGQLADAVEQPLPEPVTIHSLLHLSPKPARPGQAEGLRQSRKPNLTDFDLLIVDECSMVGKELHRYILEAVEEAGIALLFTGDSCQLQPVNEYRKSPSFTTGTRYVLTEVLRHDGAILKLATRARKLERPQVLPDSDGGTEVRTYADRPALRDAWLRDLTALGGDAEVTPVMLCWTNANRRQFNRDARRYLHGPDVPDFMAGDQLVTLGAYMEGDRVLIPNNSDVTVTAAKYLEEHWVLDKYCYSAWELLLDNEYTVYVLSDESKLAYKRDVKELGASISGDIKPAEAKVKALVDGLPWGGSVPSEKLQQAKRDRDAIHGRWAAEYFPLKAHFIEVDFGYACTIHKSQGSTFQNVYVWDDYEASSERKELLYVAITRAAQTLHHLHIGLQRQAA
jgi:hypothetical protein